MGNGTANPRDSIYDKFQHELKTEQRERIVTLEEQVDRLEAQNSTQIGIIAELQSNLQIEIQNVSQIKESANKMAYALESKELYVGRQDSDDMIYSRFQALIGQVKTWSIPFAQGLSINLRDSTQGQLEELRKAAPGIFDLPQLLLTRKDIRLLVRGYVAFAITEPLFRALLYTPQRKTYGEDIWMENRLAHSVSRIEDRLFFAGKLGKTQYKSQLPADMHGRIEKKIQYLTANCMTGEH